MYFIIYLNNGGDEMNRKFLRVLSALLALSMLICMVVPAAAQDSADGSIKRISVVFNGDAKTSRGVCWYTTSDCGSDVQVMPLSEYKGSFDGAQMYSGDSSKWKDNYCHKVLVDELAPGTEYIYRVGDSSTGIWSETGTFETDADEETAFSFIAIADVQASNEENFTKSASVVREAFRVMPDAKFLVNAGDFVNDCTNEEWDWFFEKCADTTMHTTMAPAAGNHEGNLKWGWFNNMFNLDTSAGWNHVTGVYYSFDYSNAHIAVLNTNDMYPISEEQLNWLRNDMNASDAQWKIVLMHRALYSAGKNINKPDTVIMRERLLPVIDELDIDVVIAGHDHMYMRTFQVQDDKIQPTRYITEVYNGEEITFALNPEGTVHILPNTAGTKRYSVHEDAMEPILANAAVAQQPGKSVFSTFTIDGDKLIYRAYTVDIDDETFEATGSDKFDEYAIKKTASGEAAEQDPLPTDFFSNFVKNVVNVPVAVAYMLVKYITMIPHLIENA